MIGWITGLATTEATACNVPLSQWSVVLQAELRAELLLSPEATLGLEFLDLPSAVVPSEFEIAGDPEASAQLLLEAVYNFVGSLRLPRNAERFAFALVGATTRPVLIKRSQQALQVTMLALYRYIHSPARLRSTQLRTCSRRRGSAVIEHITSSRSDMRLPSAAQCCAALIAEHLNMHRRAPPLEALCEHVPLDASPTITVDLVRQRGSTLGQSGAALVGLLQLYLCDSANIVVCNDLVEEATTFAERVSTANLTEELARLTSLMTRYAAQLRGCTLSVAQLVAIVRDIARALFGVDPHNAT